ncbi:MAG: transporter [Betaproteobacteria bacterium]|nr:transporter [Betaproteobacteria bacterium]
MKFITAAVFVAAAVAPVLAPDRAFAAHPLITEDTGTQGAGNFQLELTYERPRDVAEGVETLAHQFNAVLSYGLAETVDLMIGFPYLEVEGRDNGTVAHQSGKGDVALDIKWRFYEQGRVSLLLKPGMTRPAGDSAKGLGTGRSTYGAQFVASIDHAPFAYHLHGGYRRNRNDLGERHNLWHGSAAATWQSNEQMRWVADIGVDTNPDPNSGSMPAYLILGLIHSPNKNLDLDLGLKFGLNPAADDGAFLAGIALRW